MEAELKNKLFPFHQEKALESLRNGGRLIIIGDVHGCIRELEKLLKKIRPEKEDRIIFLGDLINRGPDSKAVLRLARESRATALLGNHELRLLQFHHTLDSTHLRPYDITTLRKMEKEDWDYLAEMILWLEIPHRKQVLVHGGFLPHIPWHKQSASIITQIQMIDKKGMPRKRGETSSSRFWADLWKKEPFVIYGHTPRAKIYRRPFSMGIDTGCVWGGKLTALVLPENTIVQVSAQKKYVK